MTIRTKEKKKKREALLCLRQRYSPVPLIVTCKEISGDGQGLGLNDSHFRFNGVLPKHKGSPPAFAWCLSKVGGPLYKAPTQPAFPVHPKSHRVVPLHHS